MEKEGLIELVEERKRGNCIERVVRATSRAYLVNPEVLAALGRTREEIRDRFSAAYLMASAGGAIRELAAVSGRAEKAGKRIATLTLTADLVFASAAGRNRFAEELASEVARLVSKHTGQSPDRVSAAVSQGKGRLFRLLVGLYPALTRNEDGSPIDAPAAAPPETQPETTDQEK